MKRLLEFPVSRRTLVKGGAAVGVIVSSSSLTQGNLSALAQGAAPRMALFTPDDASSRAFAADQRLSGVAAFPVTDDPSSVLMHKILPALDLGHLSLSGWTRGHIGFSLQEILRDRGYEITHSRFVGSQCSALEGSKLCASELNSAKIVEWRLERSGIAFRA